MQPANANHGGLGADIIPQPTPGCLPCSANGPMWNGAGWTGWPCGGPAPSSHYAQSGLGAASGTPTADYMPWIIGGLALASAGLLAHYSMKRKPNPPPTRATESHLRRRRRRNPRDPQV